MMDKFYELADISAVLNARCLGFVDRYSRTRWSKDRFGALQQAARRLADIDRECERIEGLIERWNSLGNVTDLLERIEFANLEHLTPHLIGTYSCATAHEAAWATAKSLIQECLSIEGIDDVERCDDLTRRLAGFHVSNLYAAIRTEHLRVVTAWEMSPPDLPASRRPSDTKDDTKNDIQKKAKKTRRRMNIHAFSCARRYKKRRQQGEFGPMKQVVCDYVREQGGGSVDSIMRILNDNPDQWKDDTKTT